MSNKELTQEQQEELRAKLERGLKAFSESAKKASESLAKCNEAFTQFFESIKERRVSAEMREKLDKKKGEVLEYTRQFGFDDSEIIPYLTDEILAQAVCFDFCPQTVCEKLIPDEAFKDMYGRTLGQWRAECLKNGGLI